MTVVQRLNLGCGGLRSLLRGGESWSLGGSGVSMGQHGASPCPFQLGEKLSWVGRNVPPAVVLPAWPPRLAWWIGPILVPVGPLACVVHSPLLRLPPGAHTPSLSPAHRCVGKHTWLCSSTRKLEIWPHMSLNPDTILSPHVPNVHAVCNMHHTYT